MELPGTMSSERKPSGSKAATDYPVNFTNLELPIRSFTDFEHPEWQRVPLRLIPKRQIVTLVMGGIFGLFLLLLSLGAAEAAAEDTYGAFWQLAEFFLAWPWWAFGVLFLISLAWPVLAVPRIRYVVTEEKVMYRCGVLRRSTWVLGIDRIHHTRINTGMVDRWFRLSNLELYSAGEKETTIKGLSTDEALRLLEHVQGNLAVTADLAGETTVDGS